MNRKLLQYSLPIAVSVAIYAFWQRQRQHQQDSRWSLSNRAGGRKKVTAKNKTTASLTVSLRDLQSTPYMTFKYLRSQKTLAQIKQPLTGPAYLVTRYDDVVTVLKDPRFSNEQRYIGNGRVGVLDIWWLPPFFKTFMHNMLNLDDPDHKRLRNLVHKVFTPRMIRQLDDKIVVIANDLLDHAAAKEQVDLMADFALPLPLTVISEMMGVPEELRLKFHHLSATTLDTLSGGPLSIIRLLPNTYNIYHFFKQLIELRREQPQDDLTSALVRAEEDGDKLSEDELISMLFLLLLAGHETTVNLIGSGILALLEHPDQFAKLKAKPALMDSAIEELLRFVNPVQQVAPRYAKEAVDLNGVHVPKGAVVLASVASANRDEMVFDNADQLDVERRPNKHVAFGFGIHYCLGAPLARLEAKRAFEVLFERYANIELAVPASQLEWRDSITVRGLKRLPVRLS